MFIIITRDLNDCELDLVVDFLHILESNIPSTENGDRMKWKLKKIRRVGIFISVCFIKS